MIVNTNATLVKDNTQASQRERNITVLLYHFQKKKSSLVNNAIKNFTAIYTYDDTYEITTKIQTLKPSIVS